MIIVINVNIMNWDNLLIHHWLRASAIGSIENELVCI